MRARTDMVSRTEEALLKLVDVVDLSTCLNGFPHPTRNEVLDSALTELGSPSSAGRINVLDGDKDEAASTEMLGADVSVNAYEIVHRSQIELIVMAKVGVERDALFDAAMVMIADKFAEDRTMGGVVSRVEITGVQRTNHNVDGLAGVKAAIIDVELQFTSGRPF